jgi:hypothetical protein
MNRYNQLQKFTAQLLLPLMIIFTSSCYSTRELSRNDIQSAKKKIYLIHESGSIYQLTNVAFADGLLYGKTDSQSISHKKSFLINIYLVPDSSVIKSGNIISVRNTIIEKADIYKLNPGKTSALAGAICIALPLLFLILFGGYDM